MKKYISFFKVRFFTGLQYRMASFTALTTQLVWGWGSLLVIRMDDGGGAYDD